MNDEKYIKMMHDEPAAAAQIPILQQRHRVDNITEIHLF